jgi:oxaloacetate decarboxylase alpha subunit/acetyl-CoA carboxylase biotin carboxyl carrier protein
MDAKEIKSFIDLMEKHELCELEIEEDGKRIKLKKGNINIPNLLNLQNQPMPASPAGVQESKEQESQDENLVAIKSPMVGTFYRAPSPGADPYAKAGKSINKGDVVCIIEAMKIMNEIKSEVSGKIVKILAENGEAIEFGQKLFLIEPR